MINFVAATNKSKEQKTKNKNVQLKHIQKKLSAYIIISIIIIIIVRIILISIWCFCLIHLASHIMKFMAQSALECAFPSFVACPAATICQAKCSSAVHNPLEKVANYDLLQLKMEERMQPVGRSGGRTVG